MFMAYKIIRSLAGSDNSGMDIEGVKINHIDDVLCARLNETISEEFHSTERRTKRSAALEASDWLLGRLERGLLTGLRNQLREEYIYKRNEAVIVTIELT